MDADVLFPKSFINKLLSSSHTNCFLLDENFKDEAEEMKLGADDKGRVLEISRRLSKKYKTSGEGVGFLKVSKDAGIIIRDKLDEFVNDKRLDSEYEDALNETLQSAIFGFERVTGIPWTEIDFIEDIKRAEDIVQRA